MNNLNRFMSYRGYYGSVEYSAEDNCLHGHLMGIPGMIMYEGTSVRQLKTDFEGAVDDYLMLCQEKGIEPARPYKGSLNIRISEETHTQIALLAVQRQTSINNIIKEALDAYIQ